MKLEVHSADENDNIEDSADETQRSPTKIAKASGSFLQMNDAADEFFDVINEPEYDETEALWPSEEGMMQPQVRACRRIHQI